MKKVVRFIQAVLLLLCPVVSIAQAGRAAEKTAVVLKMIDGYNHQDYDALKQPWANVLKLIVTKKMLRGQLEPMFRKYGRATIDTIIHSSVYSYVAKLKMEKSASEQVYLQFAFTDKAKLEGFGFAYPPLVYRKCTATGPLDAIAFSKNVDRLMARKYLASPTQPFNGSVMVIDNGKAIYQRHFGYADFEQKTAINDSTLYELASCSKQFTAAAILFLAKAGKLSLDDTLEQFIPGFPYHHISIAQLLTHTSGLPDYEKLLKKVWDKTKVANNNDVVAELEKYQPKPLFQPGERFEYSNTGYVMLAVIIERASGQSYGDYLAMHIFAPLGMTHTRVYNTRRAKGERIDNYAYGYVWSDAGHKYVLPDITDEYRQVIYQDAITGDGTVNSCTADLLKWERELLEHRLLDAEDFRNATGNYQTNAGEPIDYGYGFFVRGGGNSERLVFHTGGWPGYVSVLMNFFDQKKQVVILSNNSYDNFTRLADDIAALLIER